MLVDAHVPSSIDITPTILLIERPECGWVARLLGGDQRLRAERKCDRLFGGREGIGGYFSCHMDLRGMLPPRLAWCRVEIPSKHVSPVPE